MWLPNLAGDLWVLIASTQHSDKHAKQCLSFVFCNVVWLESWLCTHLCLASLVSKDNVLPGRRSVLCLQGASEGSKRDELQAQSSSGGVNSSSSSADDASLHGSSGPNPLTSDPERPLLIQDSSVPGLSSPCPAVLGRSRAIMFLSPDSQMSYICQHHFLFRMIATRSTLRQ